MTDDKRRKINEIAQEFLAKGDPTGWFEALYASANQDESAISWADMAPNRGLVEWAAREKLSGNGQKALVIGCGLGDDAEELARLGFAVTAFDISPSAIDWCKKRWTDSRVNYVVADLFNLPAQWKRNFDFVLEIYTVQALPIHLRQQAIAHVCGCVAPEGRLLAIGRLVEDSAVRTGPPWPLIRAEVDLFGQSGFVERHFEDYLDSGGVRRFRVEYQSS